MPNRLQPTFPLLLSFLLLAGCAGKTLDPGSAEPSGNAPPAAGESEARAAELFSKDGSLAAGAGVPQNPSNLPPRWVEVMATACLHVSIDEGATALLAELAWDDAAKPLTLHAVAPAEASDTYVSSAPLAPSSLRLQVASPEEGGWSLCAQANGVDVDVSYTLYGTVFYGPVPEGYTAIR